MPNATLGSVSIDLEARLAKFESDMGRAARIAEKEMRTMRSQVDAQLGKLNSTFDKVAARAKGAFVGMAASISVAGLVAFEKHLINVADNINDVSKQFGFSTQALSIWRLSAEKSGTTLEGIGKASKILVKDIDASDAKLRQMGLSMKDAQGNARPLEKVIEDVAVKMASYRNDAQRAELATKLFGKAGVEMIPFLVDLGENIDEARKRAEAFGVVIDKQLAEAADHFNDNARDTQAALEGFGNGILRVVLPALNQYIDGGLEAIKANGGLVSSGEQVGEWLKRIALGLVIAKNAIDVFVDGLKFMGTSAMTVFELVGKQAAALGEYMSTAWTALTDVTGNPIERIKSFGGALNKLWTDLKGNASGALDKIGEQADTFGKRMDDNISDVTDAFDAFTPAAKAAADANGKVADSAKQAAPHLKSEATGAKDAAKALSEWAKMQRAHDEEMKKNEAASIKLRQATDAFNASVAETNRQLDEDIRLSGLWGEARAEAERAVRAHDMALKEYVESQKTSKKMTLADLAVREAAIKAKLDEAVATAKLTAVTEEYARSVQASGQTVLDSLNDLFSRGFQNAESFFDDLERAGQQSLGNLARMFERTVLTPGGGGMQQFAQNLNQGSMYGPGGTGSSLQGWMSAAGSAYAGWRNARQGGSPITTIASFAAAGTQILPGWGTAIGAIVGALVAAFASKPKPPQIQVGGSGVGIDRNEFTGRSAFGTFNVNTVGSGQLPSAEVGNAIKQFDEQIASFLTDEQIASVSARLATFEVDLKKGEATIENVLTQRFGAILSTFSADVVGFVNGVEKLEDRVQRLADTLAAQATFDDLGLDVTFAEFLQLVTELGDAGETASQTMQRLTGSTKLLGDALSFLGADIGKTGAAFIRFADDLAEAAGGLDAAQSLWDGFLNRFFSPEEIAVKAVDSLTTSALDELADVGMDSIPTMQEFRRQFEEALPHLSAQEIVEWLQAGNAIADLADAEAQLAEIRGQTEDATEEAARAEEQLRRNREQLNNLLGDIIWEDYLAGLSDFDREIAIIHKRFQDAYDEAVRLGASERELAVIRAAEARAVARVTDEVAELVQALDPRGSIYQPVEQLGDDLEAFADALRGIVEFATGLLTNKALTPLTPVQQLGVARAQFETAMAAARRGDLGAAQDLPRLAQAYLEQARAFYASSDMYQTIFRSVETSLANLVKSFDPATEGLPELLRLQRQYLPEISGYLAAIAASSAAQPALPSYDSGSAGIEYDQVAIVHQGEKVIDAQASAYLEKVGIKVTAKEGSSSNAGMRALMQRMGEIMTKADRREERLVTALERIARDPGRRAGN